MSSYITQKLENAEDNLEALKSYRAALELAEDAIHNAQSEHPEYGSLSYPCTGEVEDCIAEVEDQITKIEDLLEMVDDLE